MQEQSNNESVYLFGMTNYSDSDRENALNDLNDDMTNAVLPVTVFVAIEAVLGFFGNIMVIYVFLFHYKQCNFRYFVLCLAFTDLTSCLTTVPGEVLTQLYWYKYPIPIICKIKSFFNIFTVSAEALALVTIAVDRYLKVCWPFGYQISPKVARLLIGVIYFIATILAFPVSIYWGTHSENELHKGINITVTICEKDQTFVYTTMPLQYSLSVEGIIGATLVIMFILYVLVARRLLLNRSSTNMNISEPMSPPSNTVANKEHSSNAAETDLHLKPDRKANRISSEKIKTTRVMSNDDSAYSSAASTTVAVLHNKGYISDDGLSSSDIDAFSDSGKKKRRTDTRKRTKRTTRGLGRSSGNRNRLRRKTLIMVILTVAFIVTTIMYLTLLSFIAKGILRDLSDFQKAVYFFFFRLYFINHVINPIIYGVLDPTFRQVLAGCRDGKINVSSSGKLSSSRDS